MSDALVAGTADTAAVPTPSSFVSALSSVGFVFPSIGAPEGGCERLLLRLFSLVVVVGVVVVGGGSARTR